MSHTHKKRRHHRTPKSKSGSKTTTTTHRSRTKKNRKHKTKTTHTGVKLTYKNIVSTLPLTKSGRQIDPSKTHPASLSKHGRKTKVGNPALAHPASVAAAKPVGAAPGNKQKQTMVVPKLKIFGI